MRLPWQKAEDELQREIAHHLHQLTEEYVRQGHSRAQATRLANRDFGGGELVKEQCRDERSFAWATGLGQDFAFGWRLMRRSPVVTLAAICSLALGIGANTAFISLMDLILWRPLPVEAPQQLALLHWRAREFPQELASQARGSAFASEVGQLYDFFAYSAFQTMRQRLAGEVEMAGHSIAERVSISLQGTATVADERGTSANFFRTLGVQPQQGRLFADSDETATAQPVVVLSHRFWMGTLGGRTTALGQSMVINNQPFLIIGVLPSNFYGLYPGDSTDLYVPLPKAAGYLARDGVAPLADPRFWGIQILARNLKGQSLAELAAACQPSFVASWQASPKDKAGAPVMVALDGSGGLGGMRREYQNPLLVLQCLAGLLLAIACTNIANLQLARANARQKEVATRIALGCSQARLMRQFLAESALLAVLSGFASLAVAYAVGNGLAHFLSNRGAAPITVPFDGKMLTISGAISAVALLLFGLVPAWRATRLSQSTQLKEGSGSMGVAANSLLAASHWPILRGFPKLTMGRLLVLLQTAMSVVLVLAAVLFLRNLRGLQTADPGFDQRNLLLFDLRPGTSGYAPEQLPGLYRQLEQQLAETPGVQAVGLAANRPMNIGGYWTTMRRVGETKSKDVFWNQVTPTMLQMLAPQLVAGRNFTEAELNSQAKVVIVSQDFAKEFGDRALLGQTVEAGQEKFQVVGIAPAMAVSSMKERPMAAWVPFSAKAGEITVMLRTAQAPREALPGVQKVVRGINENLPLIDVVAMQELMDRSLQREQMFASLCGGFGALALLLSVVGLYGVISYSTNKRRNEVGLRLALGAQPWQVVAMVLGEGLLLVVLGVLVAAPLVWFGAKFLERELSELKPLDPVSVATSLFILLVSAVVAVLVPAMRAATVAPSQALRHE